MTTRRPTRSALVGAVALLILSSCTANDVAGGSGVSASGSAAATAPIAAETPGEGEFANPVIDRDFPDPFVLRVDDMYYAYATGFVYSTSPDLVTWETPRRLPLQSPWAFRDWWAPEVAETSAGYVLYYTGRSSLETSGEATAQCIGRAVSASPEGPFVDEMEEPLICQPELGGSIDANPFVDADGSMYLLWKNDGNCCGERVDMWIAPLSADGLSLAGEPTTLGITNDDAWEGVLIEAPTLWLNDGIYYLFFSANAYYAATYAAGYATATNVLGPYVDAEENPILHADISDLTDEPELQAAGPGHQSIIADDEGDLWLAYHAWDRDAIGYDRAGARTMWIDELVFEDGTAVVQGPDTEPQPVP